MSSTAKALLSDYKSGIQSHEDAAKVAMKLLLDGIDYDPPDSDKERIGTLASALRSDFCMDEYDPAWFENTCYLSAMVADNYYQRHSYDVQLQIARFVWLTICMDDLGHKFPMSMEKLQFSILSLEKAESTVLNKLRANLCDMYLFWDAISANCIASSTMEYINGWLLELQTLPKIKISMSAETWPHFLRRKTGAPAAYGFMIFPQNPAYEVADFIQAMEDIMVYISLANDVLSCATLSLSSLYN
ncbi:hypothetical protein H2248_003877 [Termitomyces sp. 'cryptogamus']|nr:hypothetical protein H2248_003877 [Termitomyces sp. 'cryptogamus']